MAKNQELGSFRLKSCVLPGTVFSAMVKGIERRSIWDQAAERFGFYPSREHAGWKPVELQPRSTRD